MIIVTVGRHAKQYQAGAGADFQHPPRFSCDDAFDGGIDPLAHIVGRKGLGSIATVPAADVEAAVRSMIQLLVGAVPYVLPLRQLLPLPRV